jgi:polyisoprenoid-binding protein YceI
MKIMKSIFKSLIILSLIISVIDVNAQNLYQANVQKSDLKVNGTSTLHNWHMDTGNFDCVVKVSNEKNRLIIQNVIFNCDAVSLKSENSIMDKKAWEALKSKEFKTIKFETTEPNEFIIHDNQVDGKLSGELILTGVKRKITIPFNGKADDQGNYKIIGEVNLKMSDFGIEPPTALMGSIKTGDEITITYDLNFNQTNMISENVKK